VSTIKRFAYLEGEIENVTPQLSLMDSWIFLIRGIQQTILPAENDPYEENFVLSN
jgi:hypothetical protein